MFTKTAYFLIYRTTDYQIVISKIPGGFIFLANS